MIAGPLAKRQQLCLKLSEVPQYPFAGVPFDVDILFVDLANAGNIKPVDGQLPIYLKLFYNERPLRECPPNLLVCNLLSVLSYLIYIYNFVESFYS
jgi:hypothetical protein